MSEFNNEPVSVGACKVGMLRGGSGEPLLYLHGGGGAGKVMPFMTALAEDFDMLVPEHPGFGATDEPGWLDNIHDVAYFYLDLLDALDLTSVHLVGMSLGGWIAAEIAVRSTARIKTLTLAGAAGIHVPNLATGDLFTWSPEETMRQAFHDQTLAENAIAAFPENVEGDDTFLKNRSTLARLAWEPRMHDPHLYKWLHRIDVPTRVIWTPSQGSQETIDFAAHPDRKYTYLHTFSPTVAVAKYMEMYRQRAEEYGYTASNDQLGWAVPVYVGETDAGALAEAKLHFENFRNRFAKMPLEYLLPPGYTSRESMKRVIAAKAGMLANLTLESAMELGMMICGSAATVHDHLVDYQKQLGFRHLLTLMQFGTLPADLTAAGTERFARDVMPKLRPLGEETPA